MKTWQIILLYVFAFVIAASIFISISGCKSFSPVWNDRLPAECNISINMMQIYADAKDKSGIQIPVDSCIKCLHRLRCKNEIFGANPVDYSDPVKYRNYAQCLSEVK